MNKFTTVLVILVVVIVGAILYLGFSPNEEKDTWVCRDTNVGWVKNGNPAGPMPIGGCGAIKEEEKPKVSVIPFEETGNLVQSENGWGLIYEKPGMPALRVVLWFLPESVCDYNGDIVSCINNAKYTIGNVGDRVKITGERVDNTVTVSKMTMIKSFKSSSTTTEFLESGNLTRTGDFTDNKGWALVYKKPSEPALSVTLSFTPESICSFPYGAKDRLCGSDITTITLYQFKAGDRVTIKGKRIGDAVTVSKMTLVPSGKMPY
ncbi:MAG: hypothetical protein AAB503_00420 [Patescibacteria group bacterium]